MYIFHEHNTSFCLYIKHFHCIRFHLVFRISFTNICLYTLDFYVNHENTGNTVSYTVMIGLKNCIEAGVIHKDMWVMCAGFGVGLSWGGVILKF